MNQSPRISVIVPVYNVEQYLPRCVESILAQTYENLEIILVDDGSTDASPALCDARAAADSRFHVLHQANAGVSAARNAALERATGQYLQFVDGDDYLPSTATERLVRTAGATGADLVIGRFWRVAGTRKALQGHIRREGVFTRREFAEEMLKAPANFYYGVLWNKLYRREIIAQNQLGFAPDVHWAEDLIFNMGYLEHAEVFVSIPEAGYHYIQNPKSLCHTQIDLRGIVENKTQIFQLFKEVYTRLGLYEELQPQIYKFLFAFSESGVPSDSLQGALLDAMSRLNDASVQPEPSRKKPRRKPQKHARRKKPRHKEE